jgi:hypothetical protein
LTNISRQIPNKTFAMHSLIVAMLLVFVIAAVREENNEVELQHVSIYMQPNQFQSNNSLEGPMNLDGN